MIGHLTCSEFCLFNNFGRNSDNLNIFQTGKPNFSRPSNNGIPCSEVKPSILKSAYSTTLRLYAKKGKYKTSIYYTYEDNHVNYHRYKQKQDRFTCQ